MRLAGANPGRKLRILVADDTPAHHKLMRTILSGRGHEVVVARNGREALYCLFYGDFDVVLMDVQMPLMNGYEVTRAVRQSCDRHTPIIAMTAHQTETARQKCFDAGMDAYLQKPIDAGRLLEVVESIVDNGVRKPSDKIPTKNLPNGSSHPTAAPSSDCRLIDFDGCMRRLGGDLELFQEFVEIFCEDSPVLLDTIRTSAAAHDSSMLARAAHSLKGLTSNFGARCAVETAKLLEEVATGNRWNESESAVEQLNREIARLNAELDPFRRVSN